MSNNNNHDCWNCNPGGKANPNRRCEDPGENNHHRTGACVARAVNTTCANRSR